jgi:hypothetical protein
VIEEGAGKTLTLGHGLEFFAAPKLYGASKTLGEEVLGNLVEDPELDYVGRQI